ncbi:MAG: hypothetical protein ABIH67_05735 [Candidatus Uhrbacteria bacterium]
MELSLFLAKLFGLVYLLIGLGVFINKNFYKEVFEKLLKNEALIFCCGATAFVVGFAIVSAHNLWVGDWYIIITLFGWASLIKGAMFLLLPKFQISLAKSLMKSDFYLNLTTVVCLVIGLILCYFGFIV